MDERDPPQDGPPQDGAAPEGSAAGDNGVTTPDPSHEGDTEAYEYEEVLPPQGPRPEPGAFGHEFGFGPPSGFGAPPQAGQRPQAHGYGYGHSGYEPPKHGTLMKHAAIGGAVGGVLSAIPLFNILNCCFCMLNIAGVAVGLSTYFSAHPDQKLRTGDAAIMGLASGAIAGLIASLLGLALTVFAAGVMAGLSKTGFPGGPSVAADSLASIPGYVTAFGAFGALGGPLAMEMFFKKHKAQ